MALSQSTYPQTLTITAKAGSGWGIKIDGEAQGSRTIEIPRRLFLTLFREQAIEEQRLGNRNRVVADFLQRFDELKLDVDELRDRADHA